MHSIVRFLRASLQLSIAVVIGVLLIVLRDIIKEYISHWQETTQAVLSNPAIENRVEQSEEDLTQEQQEIAEPQEILQPPAESNVQEGKSLSEASELVIEAYCVKCRQKRNMLNPQPITTKNGRKAMEGTCPICSTRLFRFI